MPLRSKLSQKTLSGEIRPRICRKLGASLDSWRTFPCKRQQDLYPAQLLSAGSRSLRKEVWLARFRFLFPKPDLLN